MAETRQELRAHERVRVMPMYSSVTARRDDGAGALQGHVYDICEDGVRIELDEPLAPGDSVALHLDLPGTPTSLVAAASVVWVHDQLDDPGPRRMALRFTRFLDDGGRDRLHNFLVRERDRQAA